MRKFLIPLAVLVGVLSLGFNAYQWLDNRVDDLEPRLTNAQAAVRVKEAVDRHLQQQLENGATIPWKGLETVIPAEYCAPVRSLTSYANIYPEDKAVWAAWNPVEQSHRVIFGNISFDYYEDSGRVEVERGLSELRSDVDYYYAFCLDGLGEYSASAVATPTPGRVRHKLTR
jgi:hypothetical protein